MYTRPSWLDETEDDRAANRQTASLAGFAVVLLLLVVGLFLVHALQRDSAIEDCLLAGRHDCDRLVSSFPQATSHAVAVPH